MKAFLKEFTKRGFLVCWCGPVVLAIIYAILGNTTLSCYDAATGIISITALAFLAAGITAVYQWERLPLFLAIVLHGGVLYGAYLSVYLLNGWLENGSKPFWIFTGIFAACYAVIWCIIYITTSRSTKRINRHIAT